MTQMSRKFILIFALLIAAVTSAHAQSSDEWQPIDPHLATEITSLTQQTATIEAAYRARHGFQMALPSSLGALIAQSHALSASQRQRALLLLTEGLAKWMTGDFTNAENSLRQQLALDPANAAGNYYYADCQLRRHSLSGAAEFMSRADIFGGNSPIGEQARRVLAQVPATPPLPPAVAKRIGPQPRLTLRQQIPQPAEPGAEQPPVIWRIAGAISEFRDCAHCPELTVIPAGAFTMGAPATDPDRDASEGPQHRVTIAVPFGAGTYPVTVGEYARFARDTHWPDASGCWAPKGGSASSVAHIPGLNWHNPGFAQTANSPVVCVNWNDAAAYTAWLSRKTGHRYRLLSAAEFEYADRAGTTTAYWWGDSAGPEHVNCRGCAGADLTRSTFLPDLAVNPFGLVAMNGVVWQMVSDCYHNDYVGAPADGSAWMTGSCAQHVVKGGSFINAPAMLRSATNFRIMTPPALLQHNFLGFRIARELSP